MNLQEVVADPGNPGVPLETMPAPDDLFAWFLEDTGARPSASRSPVEIDGYPGQQVDLRVDPGTPCAPRDQRPFPQACLPVFPIGPDAFPFGSGMAYRLIVLPEVDGETVTILYSDDKDHFAERVQVAQAVVDSIDFVDPAASGEVAAAVTLTLGVADPRGRPDTPVVEHFAELVGELSDGAIAIEIQWAAGGDAGEQGVVERVEDGELDLGWTGDPRVGHVRRPELPGTAGAVPHHGSRGAPATCSRIRSRRRCSPDSTRRGSWASACTQISCGTRSGTPRRSGRSTTSRERRSASCRPRRPTRWSVRSAGSRRTA